MNYDLKAMMAKVRRTEMYTKVTGRGEDLLPVSVNIASENRSAESRVAEKRESRSWFSGIFLNWLVGVGVIMLVAAWIWWSYSLVDGNLTLTNQTWFVEWQQHRWQWGQDFARVMGWYAILLTTSWVAAIWLWQQTRLHVKTGLFWFWLGLVMMLSLSYNALSHDIFNYLFNAKMLLVYGANPHIKVALDFAHDPWTRFMHNTHTPAPYGWGWTVWSLWPVWLGQGKFLVSYILMKCWNIMGLVCLVWLLRVWQPKRWVWFAFNPLVLLEIAMNGHNDAWMMAAALAGMLLVARESSENKKHDRVKVALIMIVSVGLWLFSISIKLASVVITPLMLWWWMKILGPRLTGALLTRTRISAFVIGLLQAQLIIKVERLMAFWPDLAALAFMIPLLTPRSQQFHPWYFIWVLAFLPGVRLRWWRDIIWGLSFSSMWRYVPWLWSGLQYTPTILRKMRVLTWFGVFWLKVRPWSEMWIVQIKSLHLRWIKYYN